MTTLIFVKGDIRREVPAESTGTQKLLRRAGFTQVVEEKQPEPEKDDGEFAVFSPKLAELLTEAGYETLDELREADDDELTAIDGIGDATLAIREQLQ